MKTRKGCWVPPTLLREVSGNLVYFPEYPTGVIPSRKRGYPLVENPAILPGEVRGSEEGGLKLITHWATCLPPNCHPFRQHRLLPILRRSWASHHCPTSLGIPLANIALFLSLRMFSFSVENAKYLERVGEVNE